ncbi:MAG: aspartate aminotransferase family protein [Gammaproteobacteria bacterium]|nr:aspartate aminotransferase family protein [Gammaproteobacteria bacterium]
MAYVQQIQTSAIDAALDSAKTRYQSANPVSAQLYERACGSLPGGNTRSVLHYEPFPATIRKGQGQKLWDADGHCYTDFLGEYTAGLYGHTHPKIVTAIKHALDDGIVLCAPNNYESELAALLCDRFPSLERMRFCNSGTEANLMAVSAARAYTGRQKVMVFDGAYHGGVFYFAHGHNPINAPYPFVMAEYNDIDITVALVEKYKNELAAILIEPMMGSGGGIQADQAFLAALRERCEQHGIILIFDEVMTSRLSAGGLQLVLDIAPDITTLGKYLGGGLSFGAFGGREEIMAQFDPRQPNALPHAGTFNNNVLSMTAGLTGLRDLYTPEIAADFNRKGDEFRQQLNEIAQRLQVVLQVTGLGSILCIHFYGHPIRRPSDLHRVDHRLRVLFHLDMMHRGFYLAQRGFMSLSLALQNDDYTNFMNAFEETLSEYRELFT